MIAPFENLIDICAWITQQGLNFLVQSFLLLTIGFCIAYLSRRHGAAVQSAIYRATLVAVLMCPLMTLLLGRLDIGLMPIELPSVSLAAPIVQDQQAVPYQASPQLRQTPVPISLAHEPGQTVPPSPPSDPNHEFASRLVKPDSRIPAIENPVQHATPIQVATAPVKTDAPPRHDLSAASPPWEHRMWVIVYVGFAVSWLIGAAIMLGRILISWWTTCGIRRRAVPASPEELGLCTSLAGKLMVTPPRVFRTPFLCSPCLQGIVDPAVLLPEQLPRDLDLEKTMLHELAHLKRNDCAWNLLFRIATSLFFFQPLLTWLYLRQNAVSENVCDDIVVQYSGGRKQYAQQLVAIAESRIFEHRVLGVGMINRRSALSRRVVRILDSGRQLTTTVHWQAMLAISLMCISFSALGGLIRNPPAAELQVFAPLIDETRQQSSLDQTALGSDSIRIAETINEVSMNQDPEPIVLDSPTSILVPVAESVQDPEELTPDKTSQDTATDDQIGDFVVAGRVMGTAGSVANAQVYAIPSDRSGRWGTAPIARAMTDAEGRYKIAFDKSDFPNASGRPWMQTVVAVFKAGKSTAWQSYQRIDDPQNHEFSVVDQASMTGRIIDNEGNPVSDAHLHVMSIYETPPNREMNTAMPARTNDFFLWLDGTDTQQRFVVQTDSNGKFELNGMRTGQTVSMVLVSEGFAREVIQYPSSWENSGKPFVHVAQPSRPVAGIVRDRTSGQPIAGASVGRDLGGNAMTLARFNQSDQTVTDQQGRFRLNNLPAVQYNSLVVRPPTDVPYFVSLVPVPDQDGFGELEMDVELYPGIWIEGSVTDVGLQQPAASTVYYYPRSNNEFVDGLQIYRGPMGESVNRTRPDGSFRIVGLPGPGVVAIKTQSFYPPNPEVAKMSQEQRLESAIAGIQDMTAFRAIDPTDFDSSVDPLGFEVSKGRTVQIATVDPRGDAVENLIVHRCRSESDWSQSIPASVFSAPNFLPGEPRSLMIHQPDRRLGVTVTVNAETTQPLKVVLQPTAKIIGQIVDQTGQPIADVHVRFLVESSGTYRQAVDQVVTNDEGKFESSSVIPGSDYRVFASVPDTSDRTMMRRDGLEIQQQLQVRSGELIDLGRIAVGDEARPTPKRLPIDAAGNLLTGEVPIASYYSGQVLNENKKPVQGAAVRFNAWAAGSDETATTHSETETDQNGNFQLQIDQGVIDRLSDSKMMAAIVAKARRYGGNMGRVDQLRNPNAVQLVLPRENVIRARVKTSTGQAAAEIRVSIAGPILAYDSDRINQLIEHLRSGETLDKARKQVPESNQILPVSGAVAQALVADSEGSFSLRGVGKNCLLVLELSSGESNRVQIILVNRPLKPFESRLSDASEVPTMVYGSRSVIEVPFNR